MQHLSYKHLCMAEMNMPQKEGKGRRKVAAPRIDLTPMVDLGFLLITFFMFTTSLAQQRSMELKMPVPPAMVDVPQAYPDEAVITLLPANNHRVYYYEGALKSPAQMKNCSIGETRQILQRKMREVAALPATYSKQAHEIHVLLKPNADSKYNDLVNLLDEMLILKIEYYCIVDITPEEKLMLQ